VRLRRQWGIQQRHPATGRWDDLAWLSSRESAEAAIDALYPPSEVRLVTRVLSDTQVVPSGV